jgi:hypothetical protein
MKEIAPGIVVFKNVIDGYETLIPEIEDSVNNGVVSWGSAYVLGDNEVSTVDKKVRNTDTINVPYLENPEENYLNARTSFDSTLAKIFYDSFTKLENEYCSNYGISTYKHEIYSILKYGIGQSFNNHIDNHRNFPRTISLVYYLNDNYVGGEINFPRFGIRHKPKANELLMFPSNYVYNHSVDEVTSGIRYSVVTWAR